MRSQDGYLAADHGKAAFLRKTMKGLSPEDCTELLVRIGAYNDGWCLQNGYLVKPTGNGASVIVDPYNEEDPLRIVFGSFGAVRQGLPAGTKADGVQYILLEVEKALNNMH